MKSVPIAELVKPVKKWNPAKDSPNGHFTYIDINSVDRERKAITEPESISTADAPSRARQLVCDNDILVSTVRPNLNGVAEVPAELDGATASTGFCVLRPDEQRLYHRYLAYWVQSTPFVDTMVRLATGASYPAVTDKIIKNSKIPLPPLREQRRIAAILDKADALRRKRRRALQLTDTFLRSVFLDMFGESNYSQALLADVSQVVSGVTKGRRFNGRDTVQLPYLRVANVQDGFLDLTEMKTIEALPSDLTKYRLEKGDVLLTEGGDYDKLGRGAVWLDQIADCIHQNHVFRVRLEQNRVQPEFFAAYLMSPEAKRYFLRAAKRTTNLASINMTQLRGLPVPTPPLGMQQQFREIEYRIERHKKRLVDSAAKSEIMYGCLAHRAFRGDL